MKDHNFIVRFSLGVTIFFIVSQILILPVAGETTPTSLEIEIHKLINEERNSNSISIEKPLKFHSKLIDIARAHSEDMLKRTYFKHENPEGEKVAERVSKEGIHWSLVAENLYFSSGFPKNQIAQSAVNGWIKSEGHYQNMLSDSTFTGIGVSSQDLTFYITQVFVEASEEHMRKMGDIYDNANLDELATEKSTHKINQNYIIIGIFVFIIIIGKDAERRNRKYRLRKRFR